jgi:hypothetical protein
MTTTTTDTNEKPDKEIFADCATWAERWTARLRREQQKQIVIDPTWTTLELDPKLVAVLADGLDGVARLLRNLEETAT